MGRYTGPRVKKMRALGVETARALTKINSQTPPQTG